MKPKTLLIILIVLLIDAAILWWWRGSQLEHSQDGVIRVAAAQYGVDPALVKAVVWRESRFNPKARGAAGELGLMQIRAAAAGEWAEAEGLSNFHHSHLLNAKSNVLAGTWYLKKLMGRYQHTDDPIAYGLADYNAGRSHVLEWNRGEAETNSALFIEQIGYPSTKAYVQAVKLRREKYRDFK